MKHWFAARRRVPVRLQMDATDCGAACLAMILSHHGRDTTVREARERCAIGRDGITADVLVRTARAIGLNVRALSLARADLSNVTLPAIVHWNFAHFVVVERFSSTCIEIIDPAAGRVQLSHAQFDEGFTGVVLVLQPNDSFVRASTERGTWLKFLKQTLSEAGVRAILLQLVAVSLLLQALGVALPLLAGVVVDRVIPGGIGDVLQLIGVAMLCFVGAQAIAMYLRSRLSLFVEAQLDMTMLPAFMHHLLSLPMGFFLRHHRGDLLLRLGNNVIVRDALVQQALGITLDAAMLVVYLAALLWTDSMLGGIALGIAVLQAIFYVLNMGSLRRLTDREVNAVAESQSFASEALNAVVTVKACGAEQPLLKTWRILFHRYRAAAYDRSRMAAQLDTAIATLRLLAPVLLIWVGAQRVVEHTMSVGEMLTANMLAASLLAPLTAMLVTAQRMQLAKVHLDRIIEVRESMPEQVIPAPDPKESSRLSGSIELRNVEFRFDPHSPSTLSGINLTIQTGQKVALVGRTGGGKTTLAMLLLGLHRPTAGTIRYDGIELAQCNLHAMRSQLGVVMQDAQLFSGSIRQNVAFFDSSISLTDVMDAARHADIHNDIVRMPMGYETRVADGGQGLSGGQRQRLCLARALVRNPGILLLDEATSHMDVETEATVDHNLDALKCTRIVIAHRLSTIRNADVIVVLERGRILAQGTHHELLATCEEYARLVQTQGLDATVRTNSVRAALFA